MAEPTPCPACGETEEGMPPGAYCPTCFMELDHFQRALLVNLRRIEKALVEVGRKSSAWTRTPRARERGRSR